MKNVFSVRSPYHKVPDIIMQDAMRIGSDMFPGIEIEPVLYALIKSIRKDLLCWTFMLNRAIMDEHEFYLLIQNKKDKLIALPLIGWGLSQDNLQDFVNELSNTIFATIVSSQQLVVTTDNILSLIYSLAIR